MYTYISLRGGEGRVKALCALSGSCDLSGCSEMDPQGTGSSVDRGAPASGATAPSRAPPPRASAAACRNDCPQAQISMPSLMLTHIGLQKPGFVANMSWSPAIPGMCPPPRCRSAAQRAEGYGRGGGRGHTSSRGRRPERKQPRSGGAATPPRPSSPSFAPAAPNSVQGVMSAQVRPRGVASSNGRVPVVKGAMAHSVRCASTAHSAPVRLFRHFRSAPGGLLAPSALFSSAHTAATPTDRQVVVKQGAGGRILTTS